MKNKLKAFVSICFMFGTLTSCNKLPDLDGGAEIYCWEIRDMEWRCNATITTSAIKSYDEIKKLQKNAYTLQKMKDHLAKYTDIMPLVILIDYPVQQEENLYHYLKPEDYSEKYIYLYSELGLNVPDYLYEY